MSEITTPAAPVRHRFDNRLGGAMAAVFLALLLFFTLYAPGFATLSNIQSVLLNNVAPLAIAALAITIVAVLGAVDLSIGTAIDFACLVLVTLMIHQASLPLAIAVALLAALGVGLFNAFLVVALGVEPFLATLGTLFIGQSIQQLTSDGGQPLYLFSLALLPAFSAIGHGALLGMALPLWYVLLLTAALHLLLQRTRYGRAFSVLGAQARVACYSGLPVARLTAMAFVLSSVTAGVVGIILAANVKA